jgi:hypothetical protein
MKQDYYGYIYIILDQKHNKVYVGQSTKRIEKSKNYFGSGKIIRDKIKAKGKYFLKKIILGVCYSKEELDSSEIDCIIFFDSSNRLYGYNIAKGGANGNKGLKRTEVTKQKMRKKKTPDARVNMSKAQKGLKRINKENLKKTDEHKKKLSISNTGKKRTKESIEKQIFSKKDFKHSYESKQLMSIKAKNRGLKGHPKIV